MTQEQSPSTAVTPPRSYKDDLVKRMGGSSQYEMCILELCDRLKSDTALELLYGDFDSDSLTSLLRETLDLAFVQFPSSDAREKAEMRVKLHHFRLVENGLSGRHFLQFCEHFLAALRESWVHETLIEIAMNHMKCLRCIFNGMDSYEDHHHQEEEPGASKKNLEVDSISSEDDESSVELASAPTSPDVRKTKAVHRRRSSKDKLSAMFQSLAKKAHVAR
jgi:hypothetical protein